MNRLTPTLKELLGTVEPAGTIRSKIDAGELLLAMTRIATPANEGDIAQARRRVALLVDGLPYDADGRAKKSFAQARVRAKRELQQRILEIVLP